MARRRGITCRSARLLIDIRRPFSVRHPSSAGRLRTSERAIPVPLDEKPASDKLCVGESENAENCGKLKSFAPIEGRSRIELGLCYWASSCLH